MAKLSDTSPEAQRVLIESYRRMPATRKWKLLGDAYRFARVLHAAGLRARSPGVTDEEVCRDWALRTLGKGPWLERMRFDMHNQPIEHQQVIREVIAALRQEGIDNAVGGSLASSLHGVIRYTQDADLSAEPFPGKEAAFVARFPAPDYYIDLVSVQDAVRRRSSFNIIHLPTSFKVDVFIRKDRAFEQALWQRRMTTTQLDPGGRPVEVVSPEDIILLKLEWYRLGGEVSDQQWNDLLGVMRTRAGQLDAAYLDQWSAGLGVADLLARARQEAGVP
jgi:hypothetical protein